MSKKKIKKEKAEKVNTLFDNMEIVESYIYHGDLSDLKGEEPAWEKVKETLNKALDILRELKKKTRLTDKNDMRFTCEMTEAAYDSLHAFVKKHTKEE